MEELPQRDHEQRDVDEQPEDALLGRDGDGVSYDALARLPAASARSVARRQARRMQLPGIPAVVAALHPLQVPLALALLDRHRDAELWYGAPDGTAVTPRELQLDAAARELAVATLTLPVTALLWTRMESRGIESGRLGSERLSS